MINYFGDIFPIEQKRLKEELEYNEKIVKPLFDAIIKKQKEKENEKNDK